MLGKTKQSSKNIAVYGIVIAVVLNLFFAAVLLTNMQVSASPANWKLENFLEAQHLIGDEVTLPDAQVDADGESLSGTISLIFPDGRVNVNKKLVLNQAGLYTIKHTATKNGKTYELSNDFYVNSLHYSVSGEKSTLFFGSVLEGTNNEYAAGGKNGLLLGLAQNETFYYNKLIDLNGAVSKNDFLNISFLPVAKMTEDAKNIVIKLTDSNNPDNYITMELRTVSDANITGATRTFIMFSAPGQGKQGLEEYTDSPRASYFRDGVGYLRHVGNMYGAKAIVSMRGITNFGVGNGYNAETVGTENLGFSFDYEDRSIYIRDSRGCMLAIDLDDPELQNVLWKDGFSTGECYLSISANSYTGVNAPCRIFINSIDGHATSENVTFLDETPPKLTVYDDEFSNVDYAITGKKFNLPSATAVDAYDGKCAVTLNVYTGYGTSVQSVVNVRDNAFTPTQARIYTIVYSARDNSGNMVEKVYTLEAKDGISDLSVSLTGKTESCDMGELISIAKPAISNARGDYKITVKAILDGVENNLYTITSDNIDSLEYTFRPLNSGNYTIRYQASDYITQDIAVEYKLNVSATGVAFIEKMPAVPKYIIKNASYAAEFASGYTFVGGKAVASKSDLYLSESKSYTLEEKVTGTTFKYTKNTKSCFLTYVLGGDVQQFEVPVIDVNYGTKSLNIAGYFDGSDSMIVERNSTLYTVAEKGGAYDLNFIAAVQTFDFVFEFSIPSDASYNSVKITLANTLDDSATVAVEIYNYAGTAYMRVGGKELSLAVKYQGASYKVSYDDSIHKVTVNDTKIFIEENRRVEFAEKKAWLNISFEDMQTNQLPTVQIDRLNGQSIGFVSQSGNTTSDTIPPQFKIDIVSGYFPINSVVTIKPFFVVDTLCPYSEVSMSVTLNGKAVKDTEGRLMENITDTTIEYKIPANVYGRYNVKYEFSDDVGNDSIPKTYLINVIDTMGPQIEIGSHSLTAKVGSTVKFASYKLTDDVSPVAECTVKIYLYTPENKFMNVTGTTEFKADKVGEYKIWFIAFDKEGNSNMASYTVTVTK